MESFFSELKRARESKKISLADIASATLINVSMLEAIEQGNTSILPEAYVRAFIREYAAIVGLDPAETMRKYDERNAPADATQERQTPQKPIEQKEGKSPGTDEPERTETSPFLTPRLLKIGAGVLIVIAAGAGIWALTENETSEPVEIPFQTMINENEQRISGDTVTQPAALVSPPKAEARDSLSLHAVITDSVWVHIVIDSTPPQEYLFGPPSRISWKARDKFSVTLGNAGAIQFTLNNKQIGALGKPGFVVRNVEITHAELARN